MKIKAKKTQRGPLSRVWAAIAAFNVDQLFASKRVAGPPRTVYVNAPSLPADHYDKRGKVKKAHLYASNQVITSKYTVITFLPRNLLEQFRRVANMCVGISRIFLCIFDVVWTVSSLSSRFSSSFPNSPLFRLVLRCFRSSSSSQSLRSRTAMKITIATSQTGTSTIVGPGCLPARDSSIRTPRKPKAKPSSAPSSRTGEASTFRSGK